MLKKNKRDHTKKEKYFLMFSNLFEKKQLIKKKISAHACAQNLLKKIAKSTEILQKKY